MSLWAVTRRMPDRSPYHRHMVWIIEQQLFGTVTPREEHTREAHLNQLSLCLVSLVWSGVLDRIPIWLEEGVGPYPRPD